MSEQLSDQEQVRREALQKLRERGIDPFPAAEFPVSHTAKEIKARFSDKPFDVVFAGRLMTFRVMGKASFAVLRDHTGDQQIYIARDEIAPGEDKSLYDEVWRHLLHLGDFLGVEGHIFRTRTGEITIHVKKLTVLGKAQCCCGPLPGTAWETARIITSRVRSSGGPSRSHCSPSRDRRPNAGWQSL